MTKVAISRIWIAGLIGLAIGLVIGGVGLGLMLAYGGHYTPATTGTDMISFQLSMGFSG